MRAAALQLGLALLLDRLLGDPRSFPHPVRWVGAAALRLEPACEAWLGRTRASGALFALILVGGTAACTAGALALAGAASPLAQSALAVYLLYASLAARDLDRHARAVASALRAGSLDRARRRLARIVGRDTQALDEPEIVRAALETVGESSVDGCLSPLFYGLLGGPVGALAFKAVNTLDSMVGHRDARYEAFGWASARLDDALGWIPARLARCLAPLAALVTGLDAAGAWRVAWRDGHRSPSPNAGISEAALAGALGVQLGGVNSYAGAPEERPRLGDARRAPVRADIGRAVGWMYASTLLGFVALAGLALLLAEAWRG